VRTRSCAPVATHESCHTLHHTQSSGPFHLGKRKVEAAFLRPCREPAILFVRTTASGICSERGVGVGVGVVGAAEVENPRDIAVAKVREKLKRRPHLAGRERASTANETTAPANTKTPNTKASIPTRTHHDPISCVYNTCSIRNKCKCNHDKDHARMLCSKPLRCALRAVCVCVCVLTR